VIVRGERVGAKKDDSKNNGPLSIHPLYGKEVLGYMGN
jgi:hypothetical protein